MLLSFYVKIKTTVEETLDKKSESSVQEFYYFTISWWVLKVTNDKVKMY